MANVGGVIGRTESSLSGDVVVVTGLNVDTTFLNFFSRHARPGEASIPVGFIDLFTTAPNANGGLDTFIGIGVNKLFDIYFWFAAQGTPAAAAFTLHINHIADEGVDLEKRTLFYHQAIAAVLMEVVLHGSMARLTMKTGLAAIIAKGLHVDSEDLLLDNLTVIPGVSDIRFPALIDQSVAFLSRCSDKVQNRAKLGMAGNRLFTLLKWVKTQGKEFITPDPVLSYLLQEHVLRGSPYTSFHPQHPMAPLENGSKALLSHIGLEMKKIKLSLPNDDESKRTVLKTWFLRALDNTGGFVAGTIPNLEKIIEATNPKYSVPALLEASKSS